MSICYTSDEMMTVAAARMLWNGAVCFVGIGLLSTAANLARLTHAPDAVLIYEPGPIGAKPPVLPLSIGDGNLAETADTVVSTPEIFRYWLQGGRVDVGFLGAAQLDRFANINTTVVGSYEKPKVRLPGAGGAPEISSSAKEVLIVVKHSKRTLVNKLDFVTSVGFGTGGDAREKLGLEGKGPVAVITDLCILRPDPVSRELKVASIHPGVDRKTVADSTGWQIRFSEGCDVTGVPGPAELEVLRDLKARTAAARQRHGRSGVDWLRSRPRAGRV
jgi:glutaconate CoA-transferase subunit B